jgi:hypothetical protein
MKIVDKYVYPKSSRASIAGLRHYTVSGEETETPVRYYCPRTTLNPKTNKKVLSDGDNVLDLEKLKKLRETLP